MRNNVEDYSSLLVQSVEAVMMSVMIGLIFYGLGDDQKSSTDRFGLLYILSALYPYMAMLDVIGKCKLPKASVSLAVLVLCHQAIMSI